jgi:hypothetical protein
VILRSGRTVKLEAPFGGSRSCAFGATVGDPSGSKRFGGGAVGVPAAGVDATTARKAFALASP